MNGINNMMNQQFQPAMGMFTPQQPRVEPVNLPTYMIQSVENIQPGDVSTDGRPNLFVVKDLSRIYVKMLNDQGIIVTGEYILQQNNQSSQTTQSEVVQTGSQSNVTNNILQQILTRLDQLESRQNKLSYNNKRQYQKNHQKKEGSNNGT